MSRPQCIEPAEAADRDVEKASTEPFIVEVLDGQRSLEDISERVLSSGLNPQPKSGKQEHLENVVNRYV